MSPPVRLLNTLGRKLEEFHPLESGTARIYSCGPTVYAYAHLGNLRSYVFADTLRRVLQWKGYAVKQIINITDVGHLTSDEDEGEDKIELASRREGRSIWDIAEHYMVAFKEDVAALNVLFPEQWVKATDHIAEMVDFAKVLDENGYTYQLPSGLYFDTSKFPQYGAMARLDVSGQREGARVATTVGKRNASDFAIWRTTPEELDRQMEWDSPWGRGAPGWHLECSVMSMKYLGDHFDIHTGGVDHIPVHHTNEIAQSEAYLGDQQPWVRYWLHNEFIGFGAEKMSKSKGGTIRLADVREQGYHPIAYRWFLLQSQYRTKMDFSWEALQGSAVGLRRLIERVRDTAPAGDDAAATAELAAHAMATDAGRRYLAEIDAALSDDLNTGAALGVLQSASRDDDLDDGDKRVLLGVMRVALGIDVAALHPEELVRSASVDDIDVERVEELMKQRDEARGTGQWAEADRLRGELEAAGVTVEDSKEGTRWRPA